MSQQITREFFIEEIRKAIPANKRRETPKRVFICCPFHGKDNTPSFKINLDPNNRKAGLGSGYCFSCKRSKSWNEIAEKYGMKKLGKAKGDAAVGIGYVMRASDDTRKALLAEDAGTTMDNVIEAFDRMGSQAETILVDDIDDAWRGISFKLLKKLGCKITIDTFGTKNIILPVRVNGILYGGVKALWEVPKQKGGAKKVLKYINQPGEWIKNYGLFPYDICEWMVNKYDLNYVILVEGQRDALKLLMRGYPAMAILGTANWTEVKRNLVLSMGVEKVIVFMDGDAAGIKATKSILASFKGLITRYGVKTRRFQKQYEKLVDEEDREDKLDPGNCPPVLLKKILSQYDCESAW